MSRSPEYQAYIVSKEWRRKSKRHQAWTRNHCVLFPWCKSRHCHHLHYKNFKNELPVRDTVPLCKTAHDIVHGQIFGWYPFWKKSPLRFWMSLYLRLAFIVSVIFWWTLGWLLRI